MELSDFSGFIWKQAKKCLFLFNTCSAKKINLILHSLFKIECYD